MTAESNSAVSFTAGETQFLLCALRNLKGTLNFDRDAVARELGMKNGTVVGVRWNAIFRTKIKAEHKDDAPAGTISQRPCPNGEKSRSKKRGRKVKTEPESDDDTAPAKVARKDSYHSPNTSDHMHDVSGVEQAVQGLDEDGEHFV